jgi:aminoglycoside phosphotransferase (APT) family kinase protein
MIESMPLQIPNKRNPQVLLFSFRPEERTMRIIRYLTAQDVSVRTVQAAELGETLGYLFSLPGYEKRSALAFGTASVPEMLVMHGFDQAMLDAFLRFFREEGVRRVELKAVLTPTNAFWTAAELSRHLAAERDALQKRKRA